MQDPATDRTFTMSLAEVRELLGWSGDVYAHPLDDLDKLLCVSTGNYVFKEPCYINIGKLVFIEPSMFLAQATYCVGSRLGFGDNLLYKYEMSSRNLWI